ncbi:MAG: glycoside hydrolase, partial [Myxococcales bacterium]|nr:glycoside hydrolase [Myxococcales bacterium]
GFVLGSNFFGFEGAVGTVFRNGPQVGGLRLLHRSESLWERDAWIDFEVIRNGEQVWYLVDGFVVDMALIPGPLERLGFDPHRSRMQLADWSLVGPVEVVRAPQLKGRTVATPWLDLAARLAPKRVAGFEADRPEAPGETLTVRSPDGAQLVEILGAEATAALGLEEPNSMACTFAAEGATSSEPFELAASLSGAGHVAHYLPDGRLLFVLRDTFPTSPTLGDVVAWVGTFADMVQQREGEFTCRLIASGAGELDVLSLEVADDGGIRVRARRRAAGKPPEVVELRLELADMTELLPTRGFDVPQLDLDAATERQVVVDREAGQYLGHVTTVLLEDGETLLAVYPKGHGKGEILYKRSTDGGRTWSERLPTPASWASSQEVPTIHRVIDPLTGEKRLILWSGLYPARLAHSADDGATWSELRPVGEWGGIVVMGFVERLANGSYLAMFHDDGRFFAGTSTHRDPPVFQLYKTFSHDGGLTWERPEVVWSGSDVNLCEPGCVRSPDGKTLAVLLRENRRVRNSFVIFSEDEGQTWSAPRELPASLTGDRHTGKYAPDGRLVLSFRDTALESPTQGDWVAWVGTFQDLLFGLPGQYRVRLKDNLHSWDTAYPGVEVLPDGTFVATTYGHWEVDAEPYILSVRFSLAELDALVE